MSSPAEGGEESRKAPPATDEELDASAAKRAKTPAPAEEEEEEDPVAKLRALPTIRERCRRIYEVRG